MLKPGIRMATCLNDLKRQVFFDILDLTGRVFILVKHSDEVSVGNRGFLPSEKEKGLILVFNNRMNFQWDDSGISATLVFGATSERCFIPPDAIVSVFSPELQAQFSVAQGERKKPAETQKTDRPEPGKKIVKVDFNRKR